MSSSVDSRIVTMKFDNKQFEGAAKTSMNTMDSLKKSMDMSSAQKGLSDLQGTAHKFSLSSMLQAPAAVGAAFVAMSTVAITALSNITTSAMQAGGQIVKSLTLDPIKDGFDEYELKMGSIQTILANTAKYGTKLEDVTKVLDDLNAYSDKTIYNFGDMTKNIGLFTNAGLELEASASMIKGWSNEAAASGASAEQAAHAAQQLSQGLSAGTIKAMDWFSLTNAGMGNSNMKDGLVEIAEAMGTFEGKSLTASDANRDFKGSLEKGWLTADVMSNYLQIMAGDFDKAKMKSLGLSDEIINGFVKQQKTAEEAATKVRTVSQLMGTLRESVGSAWSETFELVLGDFDTATTLFTAINDQLGKMIGASGDARNKLLTEWNKAGGRDILIEALSNAFNNLMTAIQPIRNAWNSIFDNTTSKDLINLTKSFSELVDKFEMSWETFYNLQRTFSGIFAVIHIGWMILKGVIKYFASLLGLLDGGAGGVLNLTGSIGDLLVSLDAWLSKGDKIGGFFDKLIDARENVLGPIIDLIGGIIGAFGDLITDGPKAFVDSLVDSFGLLGPAFGGAADAIEDGAEQIGEAFDWLGDILAPVGEFFTTIWDGFTDGAGDASTSINGVAESLGPVEKVLNAISWAWDGLVGAFAAIGDFLRPVGEALGTAFGWLKDKIGGFTKDMGLEDALGIINTGFFIAIYFAFRKFMSNMAGLADSAGGMFDNLGGVFGQLTGNLKAMQNEVRSKAILNIAIAVGVLAAALWVLSTIPGKKLASGIAGIGVLMTELVTALIVLEKGSSFTGAAQLAILAVGMIGLAVGLVALAGAVKIFGTMKMDTLKQGLLMIGAILAGFVAFAALLAYSGGAIAMIGAAAAILIISPALLALAGAIKLYAKMDTSDIFEGLGKIFAALTVLALGLTLMIAALPGAAAVVVASVALVMLAGALATLAALDWKTVGVALAILGATVLALSVMAVGAPLILALGVALLVLGVALLAAGAGMVLFATGLATLAVSGAAGAAVLAGILITFAEALPLLMAQLGLGIRAFAKVISDSTPELYAAATTMIEAASKAIVDSAPEVRVAIVTILKLLLGVIRDVAPDMYDTMITLMLSLIEAITDRMDDIVSAGTDLVIAFLEALGAQARPLAEAGADLVIDFIEGLAEAIDDKDEELGRAGGKLAWAVVKGIVTGFAAASDEVYGAAADLAQGALDAVGLGWLVNSPSKAFRRLAEYGGEGMALGFENSTDSVVSSASNLGGAALSTIQSSMKLMYDMVDGTVDMNPTITPIMDLTQLQKDATQIGGMLATPVMSVDTSFQAASNIADETAPPDPGDGGEGDDPRGPSVKLYQYNTSPKALSASEIYRNTSNQLSLAREALKS